MSQFNWKNRLLTSSLFAGALLAVASPLAAVAQEADDAAVETVSTEDVAESEARQQRITVTGSRIVRRDEVAESPIVTFGQADLKDSGLTTVDQFLNTLPQVTPSFSSQSNNPSNGGRSVIDLRGLGSSRNLVLINGRRGMGSTSSGVVDINTIPAALIERVEIITGGAASTYGADAVAGVANFILRDNFEGVEIDTQYKSAMENGDAVEWGASFTAGSGFANDRGNAVFSASYFTRESLGKGARDFSAQASGATTGYPGGAAVFGTNGASPGAIASVFGGAACAANGGTGGFGFNPDGSVFCTGVLNNPNFNVVGYTGPESDIATAFFPDFFSYNFEPDNNLILPLNRWNMFSSMNYQVNDYVRAYAQATFTNYNATNALAPTPTAGTTGFTVPVSNPFIGADLATLLASRANPTADFALAKRFNALGPRSGFNNHDVWQLTLGMDGDFAGIEGWGYDVYWSYGRSTLNETQNGNVRRNRVQELLDAADGGASLCAGGLNLFGGSPISQSCIDYISLETKNLTTIDQHIIEGNINGELFELPAGTVQAVFGAQYRELDFRFQPDGGLQPGLVAGFNEQLPVSGYLDWYDAYTEVFVPLVADQPFAKEISLTGGYRITDNNRSGTSDSWKINGDWSVNDYLRFRGGYQVAIRSPSIAELFSPVVNNFPTFTNQDPCNTGGPNAGNAEWGRNGPNGAQVAALCAIQSAVAGGSPFSQPAGQANGVTGGNIDLVPEESKSYTFGFVANSPFTGNSFVESLGLTVDYWSIELDKQIGAFAATTIVQRCFNRDGANPTFDPSNSWCQLFERDPGNGGVIRLNQQQTNDNFTKTSGVDLTARWGVELEDLGLSNAGSLNWNLLVTWVEKYNTRTLVTPDDPTYDFVGTIGSTTGSATPEWRFTLNTNYTLDDLSLNVKARYIDDMFHGNVVTGGSPAGNTGVDATWYVDLSGSYNLTDWVTLRAGINNLLDQEPRLYSPNVQANTDPSTYDVVGRAAFVGINLRF